MLRYRDIVAAILAVALLHTAFHDYGGDFVRANAILRFYLPRQHYGKLAVAPKTLDVDGDGRNEALVTIVLDEQQHFRLQILDLKPATRRGVAHLAPFLPKILFQSEPIYHLDDGAKPIMVTTGHVRLHGDEPSRHATVTQQLSEDDRRKHYFCGKDWHDASTKCAQPCPKGTPDECTEGERCYADTSCDAIQLQQHAKKYQQMSLTPISTVPAMFSLWDSGVVTMHTLQEQGPQQKQLVIQLEWSKPIITNVTEWEDIDLVFVEPVDAGDKYGLVLVSAYVDRLRADGSGETSTVVVAVHANNGEKKWDSLDQQHKLETSDLPLPMRGSTSVARRRSRIPQQQQSIGVPDCMRVYRRSMLHLLPFQYWTMEDTRTEVRHFDHQRRQGQELAGNEKRPKQRKVSILPHNRARKVKVQHGKPNVVVVRNQLGMMVRSLKNGRSLCHTSLWDDTLYTDLNHDGIIDTVNILLGKHNTADYVETDDAYKFVAELVERIAKVTHKEAEEQAHATGLLTHLCHAHVVSGTPSKEELFSISLCSDVDDSVVGAPPQTVEANKGPGRDLVVALNNGEVQRFRGKTGRRQWQLFGARHKDFPTWEHASLVTNARLDAKGVPPRARPILLTGENSLAVISVHTGDVLATANFPQPPIRKPILVDFDGDGSTDVLVITNDAVWGYSMIVNVGSSFLFSMMTGLVMLCLMLSLLRYNFGPSPYKRATDK